MFTPRVASVLVLLFPAAAESADSPECDPPAAVLARVRYCSDNVHAGAAAAACAARLEKAWGSAASELAPLEEAADGQRLGYGLAQEKYDLAAERLRGLIRDTQRNTARIAAYPGVMVDDAALEDFSQSLPCFRAVYDEIQRTVTRLDKRVLNGKRVLAGAAHLRAASAKLARGTESEGAAAHGTEASPRPGAAPPERKPATSSDVTGTGRETKN